jgi:hypothetical protein
MTWVKIDDQFADHPKVLAAGPLASWLYVCSLTYSARLLTDGFIPAGQVRRLADVDNACELAAKLVEVGLWDVTEGGYRVHDYLIYNPTAETIKARQEADRQRKNGNKDNSARNPDGIQMESKRPVPVPVPSPRTPKPVPQPQDDGSHENPATGHDDASASAAAAKNPLVQSVAEAAKLTSYQGDALRRCLARHQARAPNEDWVFHAQCAAEWIADPKKNKKHQQMSVAFLNNWFKREGNNAFEQPARASPSSKSPAADDDMIYSLEHGRRVPKSMLKGRTA